jgi:putative DNA primase/helicase
MPSTLEAASGRWPELLCALGGISAEDLCDREGPCPSCFVLTGDAGNTRFKWDDDTGSGGWFCSHCGGKDRQGGGGTGVDLLMRLRGWDLTQALRHVDGYLGGDRTAAPAIATPPAKPKKPKRPARIPDTPPVGTPPPELGRAVAQWPYGPDPENPWFWIQRIPMESKEPGGKPEKRFVHRTWIDGRWHFPSRRDPFTSEWPAPRPLFNLPELLARPDAPVLVVEGEKSADAAPRLAPGHVIVSGCGGTGGINAVDWTPLAGREILLWPDNDAAGRQFMAKLGLRLQQLGATVSVIIPPASLGLPPGWDAADAAERWGPKEFDALVRQHSRPLDPLPEPAPETEPAPPAAKPPTVDTRHPVSAPFLCLGFDKDGFYYIPRNTGQVVRLTRNGHTSTALCSLASSNTYWISQHETSRGSIDWPGAFSALFARQAAVGVFDPDRVRGRGAWLDEGRVVFHLGDRLIVDGDSHDVLNPPPSRYFYEQSRHLDGPGTEPLSDELAAKLLVIAERFRWEMPVFARFLIGWIVLAPVCGALDWRPHIWVTGGPGTGKSTILRSFILPLLGGVVQRATGTTTEAGLRGDLRTDGIPVMFDEFDQYEAKDKAIVQNVLQLARVASSDGGKIIKGTASGGSISYEIRSMFCVSSVNVALVQKADADRFCVLALRRDKVNEGDWRQFEADIITTATRDSGRALIARTLQNLPDIVHNVRILAAALAKRFGQRFGDQHGTLLAGAWSLEPGGGGRLTPELADDWLRQMDWEQHEPDPADRDEMKCRDAILQQIVRLDGGSEASVGEIVRAVLLRNSIDTTTYKELEPVLGRHGLKVVRRGEVLPGSDDGRAMGHYLGVANSSKQLEAVLRTTPWGNGAYKAALRRIDGSVIPPKGAHFSGVGTHRFVLVPIGEEELAA